jgi:hypothetical protein
LNICSGELLLIRTSSAISQVSKPATSDARGYGEFPARKDNQDRG